MAEAARTAGTTSVREWRGSNGVASELTREVLRNLLRNYQAWHSTYESDGIDVLSYAGFEFSLWDLDYLVSNLHLLPARQAQAIRLCFIEGKREQDAAVLMGIKGTNPVSQYANEGLKKILVLIQDGDLPRFSMLQGSTP